jgi:coatomer subunit beta'
MELGSFSIGEECLLKAKDYQGLLLYYSCINNREKLSNLACESELNGFNNVAYTSYFLLNNLDKCLEILVKSKRFSEAALFCRTYYPNKISETLELWNNELNSDDYSNRIGINKIKIIIYIYF